MSENRYTVRPKARQDIRDQALYYSTKANSETGHNFIVSTHETFSLLASYPNMGWRPKLRHPDLRTLRIFRVNRFEQMLILYRAMENGIEVLRIVHGSRNIRALLRREPLE